MLVVHRALVLVLVEEVMVQRKVEGTEYFHYFHPC
jgi:hypothetical protein